MNTPTTNPIDNLTKEDLIRVIANMHDTIQEWNNGYGLPKDEAHILSKIGDMCVKKCIITHNWTLPEWG